MKLTNLMLTSVTVIFLTACGGGGGGGSTASTPSSVAPPSNGPSSGNRTTVSNTTVTSSVAPAMKSVELSIPEGFDFSTEREVKVTVDVASSQSSRGFMSLYTDFNDDVVDYTSQVLRVPINDSSDFSTTLLLPNHVDKVWVEVWYPSAMGSEVKRSIDIDNDQVDVVL
ncbi:hypothetical protein AB4455_01785 [Vibrio sp. 10N.261.46.E12]|uniref:hypothetical protein n=1 Tax=unclassified Vibrio TaxID=2614977 RepID=UPI0009757BB7|nr:MULTISPECIES: hypothetical protein [unclassified Vibrio]OMO37056.1 hypothetical protein BH584_02735 [Vibrio sp. 10N.261.45.E1]PMJ24154.1 hypothetical protein BCU27_14415 [Vibrio sp. 10N.286.45.B6]PML94361.1 hypothetical protein BCT66_23990 [Vibrio sp. 10N.261.49.E11]PMM75698.1 hypothetical protein BCT48_02430 [Vibrio sp. 10N.261.46.F12]PMM85178.1 hypothetical protein BCT46_10110 [Vibrio sp. 10N.261.46.E8]